MRLLSFIGSVVLSPLIWSQPLLLEGNLTDWSQISLNGDTFYDPVMDIDHGVIVRAESVNSASLLMHNQVIDLNKTPIIQWQWTAEILPYYLAMTEEGIEQKLHNFDETQLQGNDFVLRLMVGTDPLFGERKTLHYVWSSHESIGKTWAFDQFNQVIVVSGEDQTTMKWQTLARHIQKDWMDVFGEHIDELDFVAIMTDSDGIGGHAVGYYGDIRTLAGKSLAAK